MKRIIFLIAAIALSNFAIAQTITFSAPVRLCAYVVGVNQSSTVTTAVSKALSGIDTSNPNYLDQIVPVTILEDDIVEIYGMLANIQQGLASEPNLQLKAILLPMLSTRPNLAARIAKIVESQQIQLSNLETQGLRLIWRTQQAITNND